MVTNRAIGVTEISANHAALRTRGVLRDTTDRDGGALTFTTDAWRAFLGRSASHHTNKGETRSDV